MTRGLSAVTSVDDLFSLDPLDRFEALVAGPNFDDYLRAEPIRFDPEHLIYGISCRVPGCEMHSTQATWWCTRHSRSRLDALREGVGEAEWLANAVPLPPGKRREPADHGPPSCRFCTERDATIGDLCATHARRLERARQAAPNLDENAWATQQVPFAGLGDCRVDGCLGRAESKPTLCPRHRTAWAGFGRPEGAALDRWLLRHTGEPSPTAVFLGGLQPLLAAEIRYALWTHPKSVSPARWHPMWLRTLVKSCRIQGVNSLLDLDPRDPSWTTTPAAVNRIVREMVKDVLPVHRSRADTRELGYVDPTYWGFRFPDRRSAFDLTAIDWRWLRDLTWDYLADELDGPKRPRSQGPIEAARRAVICFSTYLSDCEPHRGGLPSGLSESTAKEFAADLRRCATNRQPLRGVFNVNGEPSIATATTYPLVMNALRKVMRWAMDSGTASRIGIPREFIVALPYGGTTTMKNPRPFSDETLRALSDPANIRLFDRIDPHDNGVGDIWSIQIQCGRRIGEVIRLRLDCVSENLGRTWMWVDMTKVGKLDYAIQIPRSVYDIIRARQAKTTELFRRKHGAVPSAKQRKYVALFPSRMSNPTFERSISPSTFVVRFKEWLDFDEINLPGHTSHQARHTLATRLVGAGASMTHVKQVLGHVSPLMAESYVNIAGSQVEPFLRQIWITGPGNAKPGEVVLTPTDADVTTAEKLLVDLAAIPTEHGLCTYRPVVGGFDCPFGRRCTKCEHFVITGADYAYWKRQEERWAAMAEGAPDETARDYIYSNFERSSKAIAGLENALLALGLLDAAKELDLRSPHQDFFSPMWSQGWRARDLAKLAGGEEAVALQLQSAESEPGADPSAAA